MIVLFGFATILIFCILILRKTFFSPTLISSLLFVFATVFLFAFKEKWEVNLGSKTVFLICLGLFSIFIGEILFCSLNYDGNKRLFRRKMIFKTYYFDVNRFFVFFFLIFQVMVVLLYYRSIVSIGGNVGDFSVSLSNYKAGLYNGEENISSLVLQLGKISYVGAVVFAFLFVNNCIVSKKILSNLYLFIPVILFLLQSFVSSSRSLMLQIGVEIILLAFIMYFGINKSKKKRRKLVLTLFLFGLVVLLIFWGSKEIVGRVTQKQDFFEYIGYYFAGGIAFFDKYLLNPFSNYPIRGEETFLGIFSFLSSIFKFPIGYGMEFRISGTIHGNTFTAFREYYNDFGIFGVIILPMIYGFIYAMWINKISYTIRDQRHNLFKNICFFMFAYSMFYETISAQFYRNVLSITSLTYVIILFFFLKVLNGFQRVYIRLPNRNVVNGIIDFQKS